MTAGEEWRKAISDLIEQLKDQNAEVRQKAARELGGLGDPQEILPMKKDYQSNAKDTSYLEAGDRGKFGYPEATRALIQALGDQDSSVCRTAAEALGKSGDSQAIPPLMEILKNRTLNNRIFGGWTAWALGELGDRQAVPILIEAAKRGDNEYNYSAAEALGKIGDPRAVPVLIEALKKSQNQSFRVAAADALGKIGDPQAAPVLIEALKDPLVLARLSVAEALIKIGKLQEVVPTFIEILKEALKADYCSNEAERSIKALGKIGDPQAATVLLEALQHSNEFVRTEAARSVGKLRDPRVPVLIEALKAPELYVRRTAVGALGEIGNSQAFAALIEALKDKNALVVYDALMALGKVGNSQAVPALIDVVKNMPLGIYDASLRAEAARLLGELGNSHSLPVLVSALNDESWIVRQAAAWALGRLGDPRAIPALIERLEDQTRRVRLWAALALGEIGDSSALPALEKAAQAGDADVEFYTIERKGLETAYYSIKSAANEAIEKIKQRASL
jgi:HEAT repeat protein